MASHILGYVCYSVFFIAVEHLHSHGTLVSTSYCNKYLGLGSLNNRNLSPYNSGGWKSRIKTLAELVSPKVGLLGLQMAPSLCVHTCLSFCVSVSSSPFLIRILVRLERILLANSFYLNDLLKPSLRRYLLSLHFRRWILRVQRQNVIAASSKNTHDIQPGVTWESEYTTWQLYHVCPLKETLMRE
jgi:hypothetical protein